MAAKLAIGIEARERLRRLAVVFAVELRLRIVTALYERPMSPKLFFEEFGGGTPSRVDRNFKKLVESGWIRHVRTEGPGGARRGGAEHFYRSPQLAFFDAESWALVPYSMRVACSWALFNQIAKRLRHALEAGAQGGERQGRDLSCVCVALDQVGWDRVIEAVDARFVTLFEEQEDARLRAERSGERLTRADVLLIAFESPGQGRQIGPGLVKNKKEPPIPFHERLSRVFADDLCIQIVSELNHREMSVTQFHREFGGASFRRIWGRFKKLETSGWLKKVKVRGGGKRRGGKEKFYRATMPVMTDSAAWENPSEPLAGTQRWETFVHFARKVREAMTAGTLDARVDRYLTLSFLSLDQQGWANVVAGIEALSKFISDEQDRAKLRMAKSGEKPIMATIGLAAFESPGELAKEP